jgi:MFS family permease
MLLSGYQTAIQLAALVGFWSAFAAHSGLPDTSSLQWEIPVTIQLLPGVLVLLGTAVIPESPRFLAQQGHFVPATDAVAWLRSLPTDHKDVQQEVEELEESFEETGVLPSSESSFFRQIRKASVQKRLMVGIGLMIAQNMVGLNALNYCKFQMYSDSCILQR